MGFEAAVALADAEDWNLWGGAACSALSALLGGVLVLFFSAYVGFVGFCDAAQEVYAWVVVVFTGFADALEKKPCALLGYFKFFGQLEGGHAFAGCGYFTNGVNPFAQWDVGALEDGARADGIDFAAMATFDVAFSAFALDFVLL